MNIFKRAPAMALVVAAGFAATACAGNPDPGMDGFDPDNSYVVVDNTGSTIATATIYLYPTTGTRELLGVVTMNEAETFEVASTIGGEFRLVAEAGVDEFASRSFTLTDGDVVQWDLAINQITYQGEVGR